ncbi:hypothetical protein I4U23_022157 [Adineta vaga]|nr:hypothetical protein I4U23_022157 [Adineta vaga]
MPELIKQPTPLSAIKAAFTVTSRIPRYFDREDYQHWILQKHGCRYMSDDVFKRLVDADLMDKIVALFGEREYNQERYSHMYEVSSDIDDPNEDSDGDTNRDTDRDTDTDDDREESPSKRFRTTTDTINNVSTEINP